MLILIFLGITFFEFDRNTGTLIQVIKGIRKMNRWLSKQLDSIAEDSVVVVVKT